MSHRKLPSLSARPKGRPNSEINVTPLVDVVLVLLIIFMVVTPLLEKDLEVLVPHTEEIPKEIEVPQDQIVVSVDAQSELSVNSTKVTDAEYVAELKRVVELKKAGNRLVFFSADERANYGRVVVALDGAKQAGAETLGMMTEPLEAPSEGANTAPGAPTPPAPPTTPAPPQP